MGLREDAQLAPAAASPRASVVRPRPRPRAPRLPTIYPQFATGSLARGRIRTIPGGTRHNRMITNNYLLRSWARFTTLARAPAARRAGFSTDRTRDNAAAISRWVRAVILRSALRVA